MYEQADMAELADAPDLGSGGIPVQVQVLLSAFSRTLGSPIYAAFGFFIYIQPE